MSFFKSLFEKKVYEQYNVDIKGSVSDSSGNLIIESVAIQVEYIWDQREVVEWKVDVLLPANSEIRFHVGTQYSMMFTPAIKGSARGKATCIGSFGGDKYSFEGNSLN